jgi:hypothetical protein
MNATYNKYFLIPAILLPAILILRFVEGNGLLVGNDSYYYLILTDIIALKVIPDIAGYQFSLFEYVLTILPFKQFLPIIFGLLAALLYGLSLKRNTELSVGLLFLTPLFIITFSSLNPLVLAIPLALFTLKLDKKGLPFIFAHIVLALTHFEIWLYASIYYAITEKNYLFLLPSIDCNCIGS